MPLIVRFLFASSLLLGACSGAASGQPPPATGEPIATSTSAGDQELRSEEAVSQALGRAEFAFMEGRWGEVVVEAGRVMRGLASQKEYYAAARLLGLASCKRKDIRPLPSVWQRLLPVDREKLRAECAKSGIILDESGNLSR